MEEPEEDGNPESGFAAKALVILALFAIMVYAASQILSP